MKKTLELTWILAMQLLAIALIIIGVIYHVSILLILLLLASFILLRIAGKQHYRQYKSRIESDKYCHYANGNNKRVGFINFIIMLI